MTGPLDPPQRTKKRGGENSKVDRIEIGYNVQNCFIWKAVHLVGGYVVVGDSEISYRKSSSIKGQNKVEGN
jgi:hypothetical protein